MVKINIAEDYSPTPGVRFPEEGAFSGQEFRQKFLEPLFSDKTFNDVIEINLDGTYGLAPSFLEEAFGGLARLLKGNSRLIGAFHFISTEEPELIEEINNYITNYETGGRKPR